MMEPEDRDLLARKATHEIFLRIESAPYEELQALCDRTERDLLEQFADDEWQRDIRSLMAHMRMTAAFGQNRPLDELERLLEKMESVGPLALYDGAIDVLGFAKACIEHGEKERARLRVDALLARFPEERAKPDGKWVAYVEEHFGDVIAQFTAP